ncbi:hypothetical protein [Arachidicoccus sp.]|uniref:hypothetical protein n=1 Tax=Arachidicoccus sp. TaxID=1872624 RepID=UPI003D217C33
MNDKNKNALIEQESFKMLLEEFTSEQEVHNQSMNELIKTLQTLTDKVAEFEGKTKNSEPIKVVVDSYSIEPIIKKAITDMKIIVTTKPQPIVRKYQLLLFPERAYPAFQKIFLSRWIVFVISIFFIFCSYKFGVHWNDNQQKIKIRQLENKHIEKAWHALYNNVEITMKRKMKDIYQKSY